MSRAQHDNLILTPSRSPGKDFTFAPCSTESVEWLSYATFSLLLLSKLNGAQTSWWQVFVPLYISSLLRILYCVYALRSTSLMVTRRIGPAPQPTRTTNALNALYAGFKGVYSFQHMLDTSMDLIESLGYFITQVLFAVALTKGSLRSDLGGVLTPIWVAQCIAFILFNIKFNCCNVGCCFVLNKHVFVALFLMCVSFKVTGHSLDSWASIFALPWMVFAVLLLGTWIVLLTFGFALLFYCVLSMIGSRDVPAELSRMVRFVLLTLLYMAAYGLSSVPLLLACINLVKHLEGNHTITYKDILSPCAVGCFCYWFCSLALALAFRKIEKLRDHLIARGSVWTAYPGIARALFQTMDSISSPEHALAVVRSYRISPVPLPIWQLYAVGIGSRGLQQISIDDIGAGDIEELASQVVYAKLQGKVKPKALTRTSETLYSRLATSSTAGTPSSSSAIPEDGPLSYGSPVAKTDPMTGTTTIDLPRPASRRSIDKQDGKHSVHAPDVAISLPHFSAPPPQATGAGSGIGSASMAIASSASSKLAQVMSMNDELPVDDMCFICYDPGANFVFLDCGHGGMCQKCSFRLYAKTPSNCPVCRGEIDQVVELEYVPSIGSSAPVKQES